mgnify:CR=1 FL=1
MQGVDEAVEPDELAVRNGDAVPDARAHYFLALKDGLQDFVSIANCFAGR